MPFVSITLNGFKSFAEKTTIEFNNGITGIVGPNGSGKSNITEAIRWVMGESSAKSLRGDNMADVIFGGSEFRAPLNRAEVTLVFDNSTHQLKSDATNIEVTRRVTRSGDSDYLINKKSVRLKDVHTLFMDSGLSRDSFSIISQGRVEQIFNSRPENRRTIIEAAAGVLHFKQQKKAAETQLTQTNDNLIRIRDLNNELKGRVEPLHEQSSLAKEYQSQKEQLDQKQVAATSFEIEALLAEQEQVQAKANQVDQMLAKLDAQVNADQTTLQDARELGNAHQVKKDELQKEQVAVDAKIADLTTNLKISDQSKEYDTAARTELLSQQSENQTKIEQKKQQIAELEQDLGSLSKEESELKKQEIALNEQINEDPNALQEELENARSRYIELLQEQTSNKNDLLYLTAELKKQKQQDDLPKSSVKTDLTDINNQLAEIQNKSQKKNQQITQIEQEITKAQEKLASAKNQFDNTKTSLDTNNAAIQKNEAEIAALTRFQARHEGFYFGVKNVLNHQSDFPGILGTYGDLIEFDAKYQTALNAVLGAHVQSLVANSQADAKAAIKTLKANNLGRATFLPLDVLTGRTVSANVLRELNSVKGFLGVLGDQVTAKANILNATKFLLGNILLVETIDDATSVATKTQHHYRIVTLDGDILSPGGTMSGGTKFKSSNPLLENKARLTKLTDQLAEQKIANTKILAELQQRTTEQTVCEQAVAKLQQDHQVAFDQLTALKYEQENLVSQKTRLDQALVIEQNREKQLAEDRSELEQKTKTATENEQKFAQAVTDIQSEIEQLKLRISNFDEEYQKIQDQLGDLLPQLAVLHTKIENTNQHKLEQEQQLASLNELFDNTKNRIDKLDSNSVLSANAIEETKKQLSELNTKRVELTESLADLDKQIEEDKATVAQLEQTTSRNYDLRKNSANEQSQFSANLAKISSKIDQRIEFLSSEYSISYEAAIAKTKAEFAVDDLNRIQREVKLHKMSLEEIGPVNLGAIEEYNEVKTRYEFLQAQEQDLLEAKADLTSSMDEIDEEVKKRFKETFDQINEAFSTIFPIMFGGGHAKLVLTDPEELLTTGLEIIAQPPGKKLQQLSLLSGGERALTAITLLFAILKVDPVPFCILDEVEASLDEANVVRFAKFLQNYDLTTQFIVITHRQGTMEQADQLYGVVMQESGVSKILSVSLQELKEESE